MFWNLLQDHRFFKLRDRADSLELRVKALETRMAELQDLLKRVLFALETHLNEDINADSHIGKPPPRKVVLKRLAPKAKTR